MGPTSLAQEFKCRAHGHGYTQGEIACIRGTVARCDMYINNTAWIFSTETCSRVRPPEPRRDAISPRETDR